MITGSSVRPERWPRNYLFAQAAKPEPDVLVFADGERLVGNFEQSNGFGQIQKRGARRGHSRLGKVKELHTSQKFAVIPKNVELKRNSDLSKIPQGAIEVGRPKDHCDSRLRNGADRDRDGRGSRAGTDRLRECAEANPNFFTDWAGAVTAGASLVEATQESRTFTAAINLVRIVPDADWLRRRNRTMSISAHPTELCGNPTRRL